MSDSRNSWIALALLAPFFEGSRSGSRFGLANWRGRADARQWHCHRHPAVHQDVSVRKGQDGRSLILFLMLGGSSKTENPRYAMRIAASVHIFTGRAVMYRSTISTSITDGITNNRKCFADFKISNRTFLSVLR